MLLNYASSFAKGQHTNFLLSRERECHNDIIKQFLQLEFSSWWVLVKESQWTVRDIITGRITDCLRKPLKGLLQYPEFSSLMMIRLDLPQSSVPFFPRSSRCLHWFDLPLCEKLLLFVSSCPHLHRTWYWLLNVSIQSKLSCNQPNYQ